MMKKTLHVCAVALALVFSVPAAHATSVAGFSEIEAMPTLWLEEMTWTEIQNSIKFGYTNIIIPTAGIEQNGSHVPLYKHRLVVRKTAEDIARKLGNTLIAPVIDFVPQGNIETREGHMAYPGTISMQSKVFADIIDNTARSLHKHGFTQFFLIGDSGSSQQTQERIARYLVQQRIPTYHVSDYYANARQIEYLRRQGLTDAQIGGHAGLRDTSEFMAVSNEVREYQLGAIPQSSFDQYGAWGDTSKATAALGRALLAIKVDAAVAQICREAQKRPGNCMR